MKVIMSSRSVVRPRKPRARETMIHTGLLKLEPDFDSNEAFDPPEPPGGLLFSNAGAPSAFCGADGASDNAPGLTSGTPGCGLA